MMCSYIRIRKRPEFADSSIVTMTALPQSISIGGNPGAPRQLAVAAEVDTVMLSQV